MAIFVAGASGAIGVPLVRELVRRGESVYGLTNSDRGAAKVREAGGRPVRADLFDAAALRRALEEIGPEVVIDELTSLPASPAEMADAIAGDRRVRLEGGGTLFQLAAEIGVRRYIQQSSGFFLSCPEGQLADESCGLALEASPGVRASTTMYAELESRVRSSRMEWMALRYGFFYGPGTWYWPDGAAAEQVRAQGMATIDRGQAVWSFVHVDDAAWATAEAVGAAPGVYNIVDDDPSAVAVWLPAFARWLHAPPPPRLGLEQARELAGDDAVFYGTELRGASNAKAREALGFEPRRLAWLAEGQDGAAKA